MSALLLQESSHVAHNSSAVLFSSVMGIFRRDLSPLLCLLTQRLDSMSFTTAFPVLRREADLAKIVRARRAEYFRRLI
jgi:hypothetical protein